MQLTAEQAYREALRLYQAGEPQAALVLTMQLARAARGNPAVRLVHGLALAGCGRAAEAKEEFESSIAVLELGGSDAVESRALLTRGRVELSAVLTQLGLHREAVEMARQGLAADTGNTTAAGALTLALLGAGQAEEAAGVVRPLLIGEATDPDPAVAGARVALESGALEAGEVIGSVEPIAKQVGHPTRQLRALLRAQGMLLDRLGRHDEAWVALRRAANLSVAEFDAAAMGQAVRTVATNWLAGPMGKVTRPEAENPGVLVVGLAGSGTDRVGRIIAAHPRGAWAGRTQTLGQLGIRFLGAKEEGIPLVASPLTVRGKACQQAGEVYAKRLRKRVAQPEAAVIADTSVDNALHLGVAALVVPGLRVIRVVREPVAACLEAYALESTPAMPYACDPVVAAGHAHATTRLLDHWKQELGDGALGVTWLDVGFERLVGEPEAVAREVLAFVGLEWDPACGEAARREAQRPTLDPGHYRGHIKAMVNALGPLGAGKA